MRQIESGVAGAGCAVSMRISPVTHNVYVELKRAGRGNQTSRDNRGVFDGTNLPNFNPPKADSGNKKNFIGDAVNGITDFFWNLFH